MGSWSARKIIRHPCDFQKVIRTTLTFKFILLLGRQYRFDMPWEKKKDRIFKRLTVIKRSHFGKKEHSVSKLNRIFFLSQSGATYISRNDETGSGRKKYREWERVERMYQERLCVYSVHVCMYVLLSMWYDSHSRNSYSFPSSSSKKNYVKVCSIGGKPLD